MPPIPRGPRIADKPNRDGFWQITDTVAGRSRQFSTRTRDRKEAGRVLAGYILGGTEALPGHNPATPSVAHRTIESLMAFYDTNHAAERVMDLERIKYASIPLLAWFGPLTVHEIDDAVLVRYAESRRKGETGRAVQGSTIRRELQHLRAVLNYAARNTKRTGVGAGDVPHIAMPGKAEPRSLVLTECELWRLMDAAMPPRPWTPETRLSRAFLFVALARWTAARKEAIERLTWSRVDFDRRQIDYREPGRQITDKRRVPVPMDSRLYEILRVAHAQRTDAFVIPGGGNIRKPFATAAARAGLPHAMPHALRHTWATAKIKAGTPPALVAKMMGDSLDTVMRNYVHLLTDDLSHLVG